MRALVGCWVVVGLGAVALLAGGCGGNDDISEEDLLRIATGRMDDLGKALLTYIADWDDVFPPGPDWMDGVAPYTTDSDIFQSPGVPAGQYGIALNQAVVGAGLGTLDRPNTVVLFDSTVFGRSVVAPTSTIPTPGRYAGKNVMLYADGRVSGAPVTPSIELSVNNVKQLVLGAIMYANDYDDRFPIADWMDELTPYVPLSTAYKSPIYLDTPNYGYSFNEDLIGVSIFELLSPSSTPTIFDSTVLTRNSFAPLTTIPNPGRYDGENAIAYADGSAKPVRP
jgi:hypothetical protein